MSLCVREDEFEWQLSDLSMRQNCLKGLLKYRLLGSASPEFGLCESGVDLGIFISNNYLMLMVLVQGSNFENTASWAGLA